ncbi:MAG: hypothetical protein K0R82_1439 [Flavipsychrobacter sp.]|nr:hypothetical protein [Flavipsychrobacter sp.]
MKIIASIVMVAFSSAFIACNACNADNPTNSAPSSDTTAMDTPDMTTGSEPVTYQPADSILTDSASKDTVQ